MPNAPSIQAQYQYIPTSQLLFDPGNPRFFGAPKDQEQTQEELYQTLINDFDALGLVDSLLANGFVPYEPLVVRNEGLHYSVLEGNRRLAAVKYILGHVDEYQEKSAKPVTDLDKLPCIIFEESGQSAITREQTYLGLRHFSGYKQWQPRSKAEYLARQIAAGISPGKLAVQLNTTASKLKKYLIAMNLLKKLQRKDSESPAQNFGKFWLLAEALQRSQIQEYLELSVDPSSLKIKEYNKSNFSKLCQFLYGSEAFPDEDREEELEPVISDTRQISRLAEVLANPEARSVLEKGNDLSLALAYVHKGPEQLRELHSNAVAAVRVFLKMRPTPAQKLKLKDALQGLLKAK
jgi:hypothetical protein